MDATPQQKPVKRSLLGSIFGGRGAAVPKRANLGDDNKFYYNEKLKRWVERGSEDKQESAGALPPPPPKSFTTSRPPSSSSLLSQAEASEDTLPPVHSRRNSTESSEDHTAAISAFPKSRSQKTLHGRYVNVGFGNNQDQKTTGRKDLLPSVPATGPAPTVKFFIPQPVTSSPTTNGYHLSADSSDADSAANGNGFAQEQHSLSGNSQSADASAVSDSQNCTVSNDGQPTILLDESQSQAPAFVSNTDLDGTTSSTTLDTDTDVNRCQEGTMSQTQLPQEAAQDIPVAEEHREEGTPDAHNSSAAQEEAVAADWSAWINFDWGQWGVYDDWTEEQKQWYMSFQQWYSWYYQNAYTEAANGSATEAIEQYIDEQQAEQGHTQNGGMESNTAEAAIELVHDEHSNAAEEKPASPMAVIKPMDQVACFSPKSTAPMESGATGDSLCIPRTPVQQQQSPLPTSAFFSGDLKLRNCVDSDTDEDDISQPSTSFSPRILNYTQLSPVSKDGRLLGGFANHALTAAGQLAGDILSTAAGQLSGDKAGGVLSWLNPAQSPGDLGSDMVDMKYELRARRFLEDKDGMAVTDALMYDTNNAECTSAAKDDVPSPGLHAQEQGGSPSPTPSGDDGQEAEESEGDDPLQLSASPQERQQQQEVPSAVPQELDTDLRSSFWAQPQDTISSPDVHHDHKNNSNGCTGSANGFHQDIKDCSADKMHRGKNMSQQQEAVYAMDEQSGSSDASDHTGFGVHQHEDDEEEDVSSAPLSISRHSTEYSNAWPPPHEPVSVSSLASTSTAPPPEISTQQQLAISLLSQLHTVVASMNAEEHIGGLLAGDASSALSMLSEQVALMNSSRQPVASSSAPSTSQPHEAKVLSIVQYHQQVTQLQQRLTTITAQQHQLQQDAELLLATPVDAVPSNAAEVAALRSRVAELAAEPLRHGEDSPAAPAGTTATIRAESPAPPLTPGSTVGGIARATGGSALSGAHFGIDTADSGSNAVTNGDGVARLAELQEENTQLLEQNSVLQEHGSQLAESLNNSQQALAFEQEANGRLREEVGQLTVSLGEARGQIAQQQEENQQLVAERAQLHRSLQQAQEGVAAAEAELETAQSSYALLEGDHEDLLVALAAEAEKVEVLYGIALEHGASADELDAKVDEVEAKMLANEDADDHESSGSCAEEQQDAAQVV